MRAKPLWKLHGGLRTQGTLHFPKITMPSPNYHRITCPWKLSTLHEVRHTKFLHRDGTSESIWFDSKLRHQDVCNFITEIWPADSKLLHQDASSRWIQLHPQTSTWPAGSLRPSKLFHQDGASDGIRFDSKFLHQDECNCITETSAWC